MSKRNRPAWMEDELVKDVDPRKLDFLEKFFMESQGKGQKELMAYLVPMMKKIKQENLTFTSQEMKAAVTAIKKYSTKEELDKINQILEKNMAGLK
ncbi:MAG: hypothetical protein LBQ15_01240 [Clostridium sp.]|jgi:ASC-1-like (ASCH) protein|nr:hypothetical protein [Clostridium sp.]